MAAQLLATLSLLLSSYGVQSTVITLENVDIFQSFIEPTEINLTEVEELHLFVVSRNVTITGEFTEEAAAVMQTRVYCWSTEPDAITYNESTCGIPGPTWVMTPNDLNQTVILHNHLVGGGIRQSGSIQNYHDPDVTNLHSHGLHVNPLIY